MPELSVSRRKLVQSASASLAAGAVGAGNAAGKTPEETKFVKEKRPVSYREASAAVRNEPAMTALRHLGLPSVYPGWSEAIEIRIGGEYLSHSIRVATDVGVIEVIYTDNDILSVDTRLEPRNLDRSVEQSLSGKVGWPAGSAGYLRVNTESTAVFTREVHSRERNAIQRLINERGLDVDLDEPQTSIAAKNPLSDSQSAHLLVLTDDRKLIIDSGLDGLSQQVSIMDDHWDGKCDMKLLACGYDVWAASGPCAIGVVACGATSVGAPACVLALMHTCLPNTWLVAVSGNCSYVVNNCEFEGI